MPVVDDGKMRVEIQRLRSILCSKGWDLCRQPRRTAWWVLGDGNPTELIWAEGKWWAKDKYIHNLLQHLFNRKEVA